MKSTFAERLKEALKYNGMSAAELCRLTDTPESVMSQYKSGKYVAKQKRLDTYANILNVSIPWLMGEDVPMKELPPLPDGAVPYNPVMHRIPILGDIAAGLPIFSEENYEGYTYTELNHGGKYFALKVKGDSMTAANIPDGSLVTVRVQPTVENGEIAAVIIDDMESEATLKRVYMDNEHIILHAENPVYNDMAFYHEDMNQVRIIGKAVAFLSTVK